MTQEPYQKTLASVDVGSGALTMMIAQAGKEDIQTLDVLRHGVNLGRDCYAKGVISQATVKQAARILSGYKNVMREYGVDECRLVSTSAIREAENRDYVLDQLWQATGFEIEVLPNAMERYLTYKALDIGFADYRRMRKEGMLLLDVGYGSTEVTVLRGGQMVLSRNVRLGALRLWELLSAIAARNPEYPDVLEELIISEIGHIRASTRIKDIQHAVVLSGESGQLRKLSAGKVTRKRFDQIYREIRGQSPEALQRAYDIRPEQGEILLPTMMLIRALIDLSGAETLHLSGVSLADGVLIHMRDGIFRPGESDPGEEDILSLARAMARKGGADARHAESTENAALLIFDALAGQNKLSSRERLLLRLGALLSNRAPRDWLEPQRGPGIELIGLSEAESKMAALLGAHAQMDPASFKKMEMDALIQRQRVVTAKLMAILYLAHAMDKGRVQKLRPSKVRIEKGSVRITALSGQNALLEKWFFDQHTPFFEEVFGMSANLEIEQVKINA